jgi:hypothetical protein
MSWNVKPSLGGDGGSKELPSADTHQAALVALVDLGWRDEEYQGERYQARKVLLAWELIGERRRDGKPFVLVQDYTWGERLGKTNKLRALLEAWSGKPLDDAAGFDLSGLLGKPCNLGVVIKQSKKGSEYAAIVGVQKLPKGTPPPKGTLAPFAWNMDDDLEFSPPDWLPYLYGRPVSEWVDEGTAKRPRLATAGAGVGAVTVGKSGDDFDELAPF